MSTIDSGISPNTPHEIVIVDWTVTDYQALIADIDPSIPVIVLQPDENGLDELAQSLAGYGKLDAIHLVTHGWGGALQLGSEVVTSSTLQAQSSDIQAIADALKDGGDLLLYGCSVASGSAGEQFLQDLTDMLGHVDVAASTDATGPAQLGGDWDLEWKSGTIEASSLTFANFQHLLSGTIAATGTVQVVSGNDYMDSTPGTTPVSVLGAAGLSNNSRVVLLANAKGDYMNSPNLENLQVAIIDTSNTVTLHTLTGSPFNALNKGTFWDQTNDSANVIGLKNGGFVVTSSSNFGYGAGLYDNSGNSVAITLPANFTSSVNPYARSLATNDGGFILIWQMNNMTSVYFQRYDSAGAKVGSEASVSGTTSPNLYTGVAVDSAGNLAVSFSTTDVFTKSTVKIWNASNTLTATVTTDYYQTAAQICAKSGGGFALFGNDLYSDNGNTSAAYHVETLSAAGALGGVVQNVIPINSTASPWTSLSKVQLLSTGDYLAIDSSNNGYVISGTTPSDASTYQVFTAADAAKFPVAPSADFDAEITAAWLTNTSTSPVIEPYGTYYLTTRGTVSVTTYSMGPSAPTVSSIAITSAIGAQNSTLNAGDVVSVTVTMSAATTVTGTPQLALNIGGTTVQASYASGTGTTALVFTYTILAAQTDANGISIDANSLSLNGGTLKDGSNNAATITHSAVANNASYMVDTTAAAPSAPDMTTGTDSGTSDTDNLTNDTTPTFSGTAEAGATVTLYDTDGTTVIGSGTATGGNYSITTSVLSAGAHTITAKQTDLAGNSSVASAGLNINIDATAPASLALSGTSVAAAATGVNTTIATLSATDANTITYALATSGDAQDDNNASFNISGTNLRSTAALAGGSYNVYLSATDAAGNVSYLAQTITVTTGPTVSSATYNAGTGLLEVTGANMTTGDTIAVNKLTLTGEGGAPYTLTTSDVTASSATAFSVTLNATDKAAINQIINKNGTASTSGTTFNLAAADDWDASVTSGDTSDATNGLTASNVAVPTITSATYDCTTNLLTVTGTGFLPKTGATNDIDLTKLTITGEAGATYTLTNATGVEISSGTSFTATLSGADLTNVEALLNKDGDSSVSSTTYNLLAAASWNRGDATNGSDTTSGITVSNYAAPTITSATFDASTNVLTVTGTDFVSKSGATNDVTVSLLTLTGEEGDYTLTSSAVEITSATSFAVTLNAADQLFVRGLLNKNGTQSSSATTYNLAAAEDWMAGSAAATVVADLTGNGITVANAPTPTITSATYDSDSGVLMVTGTNLFHKVGATNDIDISTLTLTGGTANVPYTIISGASDVEITSATSFTVTLTGTDKTNVDALLDQIGTTSSGGSTYNLAAANHWLTAADSATDISDATNAVTVSISPKITSATYDANSGTLVVTGSNMQAKGGATNDITANKLTFTGEGGATYILTDTADVELTSATSFTLILSGTDKAAINQIINKDGTSSTGTTTYNLAAADDWNAQVTVGDTSDSTNAITVANVVAPQITSATYNATTGAVVVTGSGFLKLNGATNDIVANKFTFTAEGGETYTLTDTANVEITSGTAFTIMLSATDKAVLGQIINKNGTASTGGTTYNLAAAEDWAAGADAAVVTADLVGNGITVANVAVPAITSSTYDSSTGTLVVTGTGFHKLDGATNDIVANTFTFTGEGGAGAAYTLADTANVEITDGTHFTLTLSATDKAAVNLLINKTGTSSNDNTTYNLAAAEDWAAGADAAANVADLVGNGITATINSAPVITSNGGGATAAVNVAENTTAVTTVTATDADAGQTVSYSITGGADAAKFSIVGATGVLTFATAPNFELPTDSDGNNSYIVEVTANDSHGGTDIQTITATVTDVNENHAPTLGAIPGTIQTVTTGLFAALPDFTVADIDGGNLTVTLTSTNGTIGSLTDADPATPGIQLTGTAAQINTALANALFTATAAGAASIGFSLNDGVAAPVTATYNLNAIAPVVIPPVDPPVVDPPVDDDNDGITATLENQVPTLPPAGGGTTVGGDGNGDGVADNQQSDVTSVPFRDTEQITQNPTAQQVYVTLVADSNAGVVDTTDSNSAQLTSVQQKDAPKDLPSDMLMPLGLISFIASVETAGITETFSLFVDSSISFNGYWKQDKAGTWCNIATNIVTVGDKTRIDFAITDGGEFDADGLANGIIDDPGAIGSMPLSIVGALPVITGTGFWF